MPGSSGLRCPPGWKRKARHVATKAIWRHMRSPLVSVVIPTFNRAALLRRAIVSLLHQRMDPAHYEIIVVDNKSTDSTADMVEELSLRHATIRYTYEPRLGVSHARNTGLALARGSIVAFVDDDGVPCPTWLELIKSAFDSVRPSPDAVGGPSYPLYVGRRPDWYRDSYETRSWGATAHFLEPSSCFCGVNMAFRSDLLADEGGFDASLGMTGTTMAFAEENDLFERLRSHLRGGFLAYYEPRAYVMHWVPAARVNPVYRLKRGFALGQTQCKRQRTRSVGGLRDWLQGAYRLGRVLPWAAIQRPLMVAPGRWIIERGVPVAKRLGYLTAASGVAVDLKRED